MTNALSDLPSKDYAVPVTLSIAYNHGRLRSVMSLAMRALPGREVIRQAENGCAAAVDEVTKA